MPVQHSKTPLTYSQSESSAETIRSVECCNPDEITKELSTKFLGRLTWVDLLDIQCSCCRVTALCARAPESASAFLHFCQTATVHLCINALRRSAHKRSSSVRARNWLATYHTNNTVSVKAQQH